MILGDLSYNDEQAEGKGRVANPFTGVFQNLRHGDGSKWKIKSLGELIHEAYFYTYDTVIDCFQLRAFKSTST